MKGYPRPIIEACRRDYVEIFKMLLQNNVNKNLSKSDLTDYFAYACVNKGSVNIVKYLISVSFDIDNINTKNFNDNSNMTFNWRYILNTLCKSAAKHKNYKIYNNSVLIAQMLLKVINNLSLTPDAINQIFNGEKFDSCPLYHCCESKFSDLTGLLIDNGSNINLNSKSITYSTPLIKACASMSVKNVELLLSDKYIDILDVNASDDKKKTALHKACNRSGDNVGEIVQLLVNYQSIDINSVDHSNRTALHVACIKKNNDAIKLLLNHKDIDINLIDICNQTPLHCIVNENFIISDKNKDTHADGVEILLSVDNYNNKSKNKIVQSIDNAINAIDENRQTALDMACKYNLESIVKIIYTKSRLYNIDINDTINTSLLCAIEWGRINIVDLLLKNTKCNVFYVSNNNTNNALTVAIDSPYMDDQETTEMIVFIMDYLELENNANNSDYINENTIDQFINMIDLINGQNVYIKACQTDKYQTIKTLINKCKIDITVKDKNGYHGSDYIDSNNQLRKWLENEQQSRHLK